MLPKGGGRKREREELVAWWYSESNNFRGMRGGDSRRAPTSPVVYLRRRERSCETFPYVFKSLPGVLTLSLPGSTTIPANSSRNATISSRSHSHAVASFGTTAGKGCASELGQHRTR